MEVVDLPAENSVTKTHKNIFIYFDQGVGPFSFQQIVVNLKKILNPFLYKISAITHQQLLHEPWEINTALLIFPGGRDVPYHTLLQGSANAKIRSYVEKGGVYLGLCAGAYYGCALIEFKKGHYLEVCGRRELGFFPGKAVGPVYEPDFFSYSSEIGARAASIEWRGPGLKKNHHYSLYYNGGCQFVSPEDHPQVTILATYKDHPKNPAAIVHCKVESGSAILCGVHPEYPSQSLNSLDPHLLHVLPGLIRGEKEREIFWNHLISLALTL